MSWRAHENARQIDITHPWWTNDPEALWNPNILGLRLQDPPNAGLQPGSFDPQLRTPDIYGIYGNKFKVHLDVHQFSPNELSVNTVCSNVYIHGKHEEKTDEHGFITREFTRRYILPDTVDHENVTASLSPNGILTVKAPARRTGDEAPRKEVPIIENDVSIEERDDEESNGMRD